MRRLGMLLLVLVAATPAKGAQPGYHKVAGVAAGDVLNIRAEPDGKSEVLGSLKPGAAPVEVLEIVEKDGAAWGRVHAADSDGYVAMQFLATISVPVIGETLIPQGLACTGTEPFWNVTLSTEKGLVYSAMAQDGFALPIKFAKTAIGRSHRFSIVAGDGKTRATAMLGRNEECSDGMSGRNFSWRIDMLVERGGDAGFPQLHEGCCQLRLAQ